MREKYLDGLRGFSALCVAIAHAQVFRYGNNALPPNFRIALSDLGTIGVQIFFVISGYVIARLLLGEERDAGRINISAFFARRFFRIVPPLLIYLVALVYLRISGANGGMFYLDARSVLSASLFVCNTTLIGECQWFVGHTWSLAVEEQFYLVMPFAMLVLRPKWRLLAITSLLVLMLVLFLQNPLRNQSNPLSFACICAGILYALVPALQDWVKRGAVTIIWLALAVLLVAKQVPVSQVANPLLLIYLIFGARELPWLRWLLESKPLQILGLCSYSLYLWQQLFLADLRLYITEAPPIFLLPLVVLVSAYVVERHSTRMGKLLSAWLKARSQTLATQQKN